MLIFALILTISICSPTNAKQSICETDQDPNYFQTTKFNNLCYFFVEGAIAKVNKRLPSGKFHFDITMAREICREKEATLPIITNSAQNEFLAKQFQSGDKKQKVLGIVLGLKQVLVLECSRY